MLPVCLIFLMSIKRFFHWNLEKQNENNNHHICPSLFNFIQPFIIYESFKPFIKLNTHSIYTSNHLILSCLSIYPSILLSFNQIYFPFIYLSVVPSMHPFIFYPIILPSVHYYFTPFINLSGLLPFYHPFIKPIIHFFVLSIYTSIYLTNTFLSFFWPSIFFI